MNSQELAEALRQLPEARIRVVELAERLVDQEGRMPRELSEEDLQEMEEAAREVENYTWGVQRLLNACAPLIFPRSY